MRKMLLLLSMWLSNEALAFPSNIRFGYPTCAACHINPTGGGVLTPYGRSTLTEVMTTWSYEGEEELLWGLFKPSKRIDVGASARWLELPEQGFLMAREAEVAMNYKRTIYGVVSGGVYGRDQFQDSLRHYIMSTDQKSIWFKAGRFFPAYGIMSNEHFMLYRGRHFNEGRETYNAEVIYRGQWFEAAGSKIFGHPKDKEQGFVTNGFTGRLLLMPPKARLSTGFSVLGLVDKEGKLQTHPAFSFLWGPIKQLEFEAQAGKEDVYGRVSIEPYQGFSVKPTAQWVYNSDARFSLVLEWLPRPHFDMQMIFEDQRYIFQYHFYI